ncbi:SDR family oxidoreductase [Swingsia samuiensis]|uniref:SDR family NAD(P)-dependent oxidoreductase n=1 Tax=Swingsia samuiensis TaxID=1293412 RepID=A0A4Y6UJR7_9PROT|nr:SDR family oxidoreductase [Swingsia samuiensis]QDH16888.1 SDR family NAD(P)-dependent oxidoreductase [Swingsia samuiensis]
MKHSSKKIWSVNELNRLDGKTAIITGATSGLGFEIACGLATCGANIILTGRNNDKGYQALDHLYRRVPSARALFENLDLASLSSIASFAHKLKERNKPIHLLANNAGLFGPPHRLETEDGFEIQFGTNHLGHFALTGRLLPLLASGNATIMTVSSLAALKGQLPFGDLNARHYYSARARYRQSKLANLLFSLELNRRAQKAPWPIHSRAAHPGWAASNIFSNNTLNQKKSVSGLLIKHLVKPVFNHMSQTVEEGAWPLLYSLASPYAEDGEYYGPQDKKERLGNPGLAQVPILAQDQKIAKRLWNISENMTGVKYGLL